MRRLFGDMNPMLRGFVLIALVAAVIVVLQLQSTLVAISALLQIAFLLAIAFFIYLVWREQRHDIAAWPARSRAAFYGGAALIVIDIGAFWYDRPSGPDALAFFLVLGFSVLAMYRTWRDQRTYV